MALPPGSRLGPYEVTAKIGAGGMGEVYRARDTRLKRDVALKILPPSFAATPDRLARFQREAEVLASLNHPHIAQIYGIESAGDTQALVMELVEGETLAASIARGPIPLDEALPIARQMCEALDAAHAQHVIHRDLKPANISVRPDGTVKVLDFGLAKLADTPASSASDISLSPTITSPAQMTGIGTILGTAAYMSPEQARGKPVDKRADIWAFGCVLFEMLAGKRAFAGEDVSDTLAELLKREPEWSALPPATPEPIRRLLRRCLVKDRKSRLPDIGAAILEIDDALKAPVEGLAPAMQSSRGRWLGWGIAAVLGAAAMVLGVIHFGEARPSPPPTVRFTVGTPIVRGNPNNIALSPDGRQLVFAAFDDAGKRALWIRPLNGSVARPIPGTDEGLQPFWSPDNRHVGFFASGKMRTVDTLGSAVTTLCDAPGTGGSWSHDGVILFGGNDGLYQVPAAGGSPRRVTTVDSTRREVRHNLPYFLPDDRHFLFLVQNGAQDQSGIHLGSLDDPKTSLLVRATTKAEYAAGYLLVARNGSLTAQPLDGRSFTLSGEPVTVADQVSLNVPNGQVGFSVSAGVLAYRSRATGRTGQLEVLDRTGQRLNVLGEPALYGEVELSPDGKRADVVVRDATQSTRDEWMLDVARGVRTRQTFAPGDEFGGKWAPGGDRIVFLDSGHQHPGLYIRPASGGGTPELLLESDQIVYPDSWSPDGRWVLYETDSPKTSWDLWVKPVTAGRAPWPLTTGAFREESGRFSPDQRWVAYQSTESGRDEIYVTPFVDPEGAAADHRTPGGKVQISSTGGTFPRWRRDGKELFYVAADNRLMAAEVDGQGPTFTVGAVRPLFAIRLAGTSYAYSVTGDGERFLVSNLVEPARGEVIDVVLNWMQDLRK